MVKEVPYKANLTVTVEEHQQKTRRSYFKSEKSLVAGAPWRIPRTSVGMRKGECPSLDSEGS